MAVYYALCRIITDYFEQTEGKPITENNQRLHAAEHSMHAAPVYQNIPKSTIQTAVAQGVLSLMMERCFGISVRAHIIMRQPGGKPHFTDLPYHFSISHSGEWVACAVGTEPCGIDVQQSVPHFTSFRLAAISQRWFSSQDQQRFINGVNFYTLWCENESYLKYIGTGLNTPMRLLEKHGADVSVPGQETGVMYHCRTPIPALYGCLCVPPHVRALRVNLPHGNILQKKLLRFL